MKSITMNLLLFCLLSFTASFVFAVEPSHTKSTTLRWAADTESGAPYGYVDPASPSQMIGFEVEIVDALCQEMGCKPLFVQNSWDGLIPGLNRKDYDIAINGIEITEDRKQQVLFSDPYYVTSLQITTRKDHATQYLTLADLAGHRVGTLKSALSERVLRAQENIEVVTYESEFNAFQDVINGRTDATLFDAPIAIYYGATETELLNVGAPISSMQYGIAIRKEDMQLKQDINLALQKMIKSGKLREILERWNLWNTQMALLTGDTSPTRTPPTRYQEFLKQSGKVKGFSQHLAQYKSYLRPMMRGAVNTLKISLVSMVLAVLLGMFLAIVRMYGPNFLGIIVQLYIELIRGTPLLLQLFFIFYALPNVGIKFSPLTAAILGLGLNYSAYEAENYRAGILSVPRQQFEAALALGMSRFQAIWHIVLPQAFRLVIPPATNDFISLLKDSSLVSVITMVELTKVYGQLASSYFDYFGVGIMVALIYLLMGLPFVRLAKVLEKKYSRGYVGHTSPKNVTR